MNQKFLNKQPMKRQQVLLLKLCVVALGMFVFGYALVPLYRAICEITGINILTLTELQSTGASAGSGVDVSAMNTQVDTRRTITVEFDANARGVWTFKPAQNSMVIHPGALNTVMYEFQNVQNRQVTAQAIPSYAPAQAAPYFNKLECFCFNQYVLEAGEKKQWPVTFIVDPKISPDVHTITLSYTFFEVGGKVTPTHVSSVSTPSSLGDIRAGGG